MARQRNGHQSHRKSGDQSPKRMRKLRSSTHFFQKMDEMAANRAYNAAQAGKIATASSR